MKIKNLFVTYFFIFLAFSVCETFAKEARALSTAKESDELNYEDQISNQLSTLDDSLSSFKKREMAEGSNEVKKVESEKIRAAERALNEVSQKLSDLKQSTQMDWKAKRAIVNQSLYEAKSRINELVEREKFEDYVNDKLEKIDNKISDLSAQVRTASASNHAEIERQIQKLRAERDELGRNFERFKESSSANLEDAKKDFQKAFESIGKVFKDIFS